MGSRKIGCSMLSRKPNDKSVVVRFSPIYLHYVPSLASDVVSECRTMSDVACNARRRPCDVTGTASALWRQQTVSTRRASTNKLTRRPTDWPHVTSFAPPTMICLIAVPDRIADVCPETRKRRPVRSDDEWTKLAKRSYLPNINEDRRAYLQRSRPWLHPDTI